MKLKLLRKLENEHQTVHGCYRPVGGPCFYIASDATTEDFGRRQGRHFVALIEERDELVRPKVSLTFLVAEMAKLRWGNQIGNLDEFCRDVGLERFREVLERDYRSERDERIVLTRESEEVEFQRPDPSQGIRRYQALKNEIVHVLAGHHAQGQKRVTNGVLHQGLCDDPRLITRALNELVEQRFLRDLNHTGGMRLTPEGQEQAERALPTAPQYSLAKIQTAMWVLECEAICIQGTAFDLADYGTVTSAHVVHGTRELRAFRADMPSDKFAVTIEKQNPALDLAIIKIANRPSSYPLELTNTETQQMDHVAVCGFPNFRLGDSGVLSPGIIVGTRMKSGVRRLLTNAGIVTGMSGGPAISADNRVIGVCVTGASNFQSSQETEDQSIIPIKALDSL